MKLLKTSAIVAAALTTCAHAAFITGSVQLSSQASTVNINYATNTVTFLPSAPAINAQVAQSQGTIATLLPVGTLVVYQNFSYDPLSVSNPIWTSGTTWFNLTEVTSIYEAPNSNALLLFGRGTINTTASGYESTAGDWSFSADRANNSVAEFSWSSTAAGTSRVPDGGSTVALLGASLLGLGGARRYISSLKK